MYKITSVHKLDDFTVLLFCIIYSFPYNTNFYSILVEFFFSIMQKANSQLYFRLLNLFFSISAFFFPSLFLLFVKNFYSYFKVRLLFLYFSLSSLSFPSIISVTIKFLFIYYGINSLVFSSFGPHFFSITIYPLYFCLSFVQSKVGGLFGVMEAVESSAGLVGPALGGILFRLGPNVPLVTVVAIYSLVFVAIFLYYRDTIVKRERKRKSPAATASSASNVAVESASVSAVISDAKSNSKKML